MANLFLTCGTGLRIFYAIALALDGIIYGLIDIIYSLFIVVTNSQLFSATTFESFSTRIYSIIGVVMLFVIAIQLLKGVIDPDKMSSGNTSTGTLVKNVLITLILIVILPTGFKYLYKIQKLVVEENIIANIIVGGYTSGKEANDLITNTGKDLSFRTFTAFINPAGYMGNNDIGCSKDASLTFCTIYRVISNYGSDNYGKVSLFNVENIRAEIDNEKVEYRWGISGVAGLLIAYMLLSFTIDVAVRVAKLAYYQLIAPVPIVLRIIPKQQSIFDNWLKGLLSTYLGLFIRLIVIYFGLYLINLIPGVWNNVVASGGGSERTIVNAFAKIALIFGVLIFMKEAPKLISQMFGVSDGDMSLGIGKKLAGAAVVGTVGGKALKSTTGRISGTLGGMSQGMDLKSAWMNQGRAGAKAGGWQFGSGRTNAYQVVSGTMDKNKRETAYKARAKAAQEASFARKDVGQLQKIFGSGTAYESFKNKVASTYEYKNWTAAEQNEYASLLAKKGSVVADNYGKTVQQTHTDDLMKQYATAASSGSSAEIDKLEGLKFTSKEIEQLKSVNEVYKVQGKRQEGFEKKKAQADFVKAIADAQKNAGAGATPPSNAGANGGTKK